MHILMTADTLGGVWTYTRELASGLVARGHRVTLVSLGQLPTKSQSEWIRACPEIDYRATSFRLEWMQDSAEDIERSASYLGQVIRKSRPDVLHFNQYCYGSLQTSIPGIVVAHSDVLSWWSSVHNQPAPRNAWIRWYSAIVAAGLCGASYVVAPSQWMLDALAENYSFPAPSGVIYNGRKADLFEANHAKRDRVLCVGRVWDQAKQITLLLQSHLPLPICVVGQRECMGANSENLEASKNPNLKFCGEQSEDELRSLYAESSVYAATSKYEPFGLAPLEAALSRCTLIANDIPVFRELWNDAALFFGRNDAASLVGVISQIAANPKLATEFADRAYERARTRFQSSSMVDQYEQLYSKLTGRRADA